MRTLATTTLLLALASPLPTHAQGLGGLWDGARDRLAASVSSLGQAFGREPAGGCKRHGEEHRIDWLAFANEARGPSGVPNRAASRSVSGNAGPVFSLSYGGLTRRFTFDRPETVQAPGLPLGGLEIGVDLMAYGEIAEVHLMADTPVDRLTFVFEGLGTTYGAATSVTDGVWVEGIAPDGRRVAPAYLYPTLPPQTSANLVERRVQDEGFGDPWAWGMHGDPTPLPLTTTFREPVVGVVLRATGGPADQGGWADGSYGANPPPQSFLVSSAAFCLDR
jgi:hypothetical protein